MQDFRKLRVWHAAHALSLHVIRTLTPRACRTVPGLRAQAIRAATSVPWNIAEGSKCESQREFLQYLGTSFSSLGELEAQLLTARDSKVFSSAVHRRFQNWILVVRRMLTSLTRVVERDLAEEEARVRRANSPRSPSKRPAPKRRSSERPSSERSNSERPSSKRRSSERRSSERPSSERPSSKRPPPERPNSDRP